jgi:hypothetical protein
LVVVHDIGVTTAGVTEGLSCGSADMNVVSTTTKWFIYALVYNSDEPAVFHESIAGLELFHSHATDFEVVYNSANAYSHDHSSSSSSGGFTWACGMKYDPN